MEINDLINPLRYKNLKDINTNGILQLGKNVFPEPSTLDHLAILDLVTKAYQAVHLPTLGNTIIPFSTEIYTSSQSDSDTSVTLIDLTSEKTNNVVVQLESVSLESSANNYGLSQGVIAIAKGASGTPIPIADIKNIDDFTSSTSKLVWGNTTNDFNNKQDITPRSISVTSGEKLMLLTKSAPSSSITWQVLTRKLMQ